MKPLPTAIAAALLLATPAAAQSTGETVSFPLGAGIPDNHIEFVTRVKNTNYFSETAIKHSTLAANVVYFDIINGRLDNANVTEYDYIRFYLANCDTMNYGLYAQTEGYTWTFAENMSYVSWTNGKPIGGTTPEGIRAGEACRDLSLLFK